MMSIFDFRQPVPPFEEERADDAKMLIRTFA
jgi:hypothetical protein